MLKFLLILWPLILWGANSQNPVIKTPEGQVFYLNHAQKLAVKLNDTLKNQMIHKWGIKELDLPKDYRVIDFDLEVASKKGKLKANNSTTERKLKQVPGAFL